MGKGIARVQAPQLEKSVAEGSIGLRPEVGGGRSLLGSGEWVRSEASLVKSSSRHQANGWHARS